MNEGNTTEVGRILGWIDHFQKAYDSAKYATIPQLPLEVAVVQSCIPQQSLTMVVEERVHTSIATARPAPVQIKTSAPSAATPVRTSVPARSLTQRIPAEPVVEVSHQTLQKTAAISFDVLMVQWPHVVKAIKNVTAKRTLAAGKVVGFEKAEVQIAFATQFHAAKMKEFANRLAVEEALFTVFQVQLKVAPIVDASLAPKVEAAPQDGLGGDIQSAPAEPVDEKTSQLLAMMGGELIE